jgi:hypothetical protein
MRFFDRVRRAFREFAGPPAMPKPRKKEKERTLLSKPRSGRPDATLLRSVAEQVAVVRAAINAKKRHVTALQYQVEGPDDTTARMLEDLLAEPMPGYSWRQWISEVLEDVLVLDAACIYPWPTRGGDLYGLMPVDAATIAKIPNDQGILPEPPETAYEQQIDGVTVASLTTEELIYESMNPRPQSLYGLSPTEVVLHTALTMLRRMTYAADEIDSSNVPAFFGEVPSGWTTAQISEWQDYWDAMVENKPHRGVWGPAEMNATFPPQRQIDIDFDTYLVRLVCAVFEVQPQELGFTMDVNRATGDSQEVITQRRSVRPLAGLIVEAVDQVFGLYDYGDYGLVFPGLQERARAEIREDARTLVPIGVLTPNDVRGDLGLEPLPGGDTPQRPGLGGMGLSQSRRSELAGKILRAEDEVVIDPLGPDDNNVLLAIEDEAVKAVIESGADVDLRALLKPIDERLMAGEEIDDDLIDELADEIGAAHGNELARLTPNLVEMAQSGVDAAAAAFAEAMNITLDWSLANADAATWAREYGYELIQGLSETTAKRVGAELGTWVEAREDFPALVDRLAAILQDEARAELIASTEGTRVYAEGNLVSWRQARDELGLTFVKVWRTARDDLVCPLCGPMDGQRAQLDAQTWHHASNADKSVGMTVSAPPMHPRCRCWLVTAVQV